VSVLLQLHWLPVRWRVQFKLCSIMHSVLYGTCPAYLTNIVESAGVGRTRSGLRSTSSTDFTLSRGCARPSVNAAWNALTDDLRKFRKQSKAAHYFTLAFNVPWLSNYSFNGFWCFWWTTV